MNEHPFSFSITNTDKDDFNLELCQDGADTYHVSLDDIVKLRDCLSEKITNKTKYKIYFFDNETIIEEKVFFEKNDKLNSIFNYIYKVFEKYRKNKFVIQKVIGDKIILSDTYDTLEILMYKGLKI